MKSKTISNSKYKNVGILFELLVRQVTADTLAGKSSSKAIDIMTRHFNTGTELGKELQLYRAFFEAGRLSEAKAIHFIDLIIQHRKKLDEKKLLKEKYTLIKEIKDSYPLKDFLSCRIKEYTVYASIYKTFLHECTQSETVSNVTDLAKARFTLIECLSGEPKSKKLKETEALMELKNQTEDLRLLTYKLVLNKFNERYSGLDVRQKTLLREYIGSMSDGSKLGKFIREEALSLKGELVKSAKTERDKVLRIKLSEVTTSLDKLSEVKKITDSEVSALLIAYQILKELNNV